MEELESLVVRARALDVDTAERHDAFGELIKRFQDMAYGCAYAVLRDFHTAQDAAQEAFVAAYRDLPKLRDPKAFPGWFRRIVIRQCNRLTRGGRLLTVPLEDALDVPSGSYDPATEVEVRDLQDRVLAAIGSLPEHERIVTMLFYIEKHSQNEIAQFLEEPVTTINKRLYSARQRLKESLLYMVQDSLQDHLPSKDDRFVEETKEKVQRLYEEALESFVDKVKQDRYIIAAILLGSLAYDEVWEKSDIDVFLIGRDEKKRSKGYCLVENGINIHAAVIPRGEFKKMIEGSLRGSFIGSTFSKSKLLFSTDETIKEYYKDVHRLGARDREMHLMKSGNLAVYYLAKAEKWFYVKKDIDYSFFWIMKMIDQLATIEVFMHDEVAGREVIHQALRHNPSFFKAIYIDLIHKKKDEKTIGKALGMINGYLDDKIFVIFKPILDFLRDAGGIRSTTEIDEHFSRKAQVDSLALAYEWLADKDIIQKVSSPLRLNEKSKVTVEEASYYYDGGG
jgi:RNA polymerase sigma factor (sigma-70 family)